MKYKMIILCISIILLTYFIYNKNYQKTINITSINSLNDQNNYNNYLSSNLSNIKYKYNLNIDFTNKNLEIENLLGKIQNNYEEIQSIIHNSDLIIISLGNIDILSEDINTINNELKELFKEIRKYNTKEIIFISPNNIKNITNIKEICKNYKINYVNGRSLNNPKLIANYITNHIQNIYTNNVNNYA